MNVNKTKLSCRNLILKSEVVFTRSAVSFDYFVQFVGIFCEERRFSTKHQYSDDV